MYEYGQVINGIAKYIDEEIVGKIEGWKKWVVGSAAGIALSNSADIFNQFKNSEYVKMLNLVDKDGKIDVDKIYKEMKKQAKKGSVTFNLPLLGALTLNEQDVERIYESIKEQKI